MTIIPASPSYDIKELQALAQVSPLKWGNAFSIADALKPRPRIKYVINGLFPRPSVALLYGASGSLKSLMLADAAACVAGGKPWLTPKEDAIGVCRGTTQTPVLWLDFDNGKRLTLERFEAAARGHGLSKDAPLYFYSMPEPKLDMNTDEGTKLLQEAVESHEAGFVIIDNLRAVSGNADENASTMEHILSRFRSVAESCEAAIVIIHHTNKSGGMRGSTAIAGAIDLSLEVQRKVGSTQLVVQPDKQRFAPIESFACELDYEHKPNTQGELQRVRFYGVRIKVEAMDADPIDAGIIALLKAEPQGKQQSDLCEQVAVMTGKSKNKARIRLLALVTAGTVQERNGPSKNAKLYSLVAGN